MMSESDDTKSSVSKLDNAEKNKIEHAKLRTQIIIAIIGGLVAVTVALIPILWRSDDTPPDKSPPPNAVSPEEIRKSAIPEAETLRKAPTPEKLEKMEIRYFVEAVPAIEDGDADELIAAAWASWQKIAPIPVSRVTNKDDANVIVSTITARNQIIFIAV